MRNLGPGFFEPALPIPEPGLQLHRATQMIGVIDRVRLGAFDLNMRIIDPVFILKLYRQGALDPK